MNTLKIVVERQQSLDSETHYFTGFTHLVAHRGKFEKGEKGEILVNPGRENLPAQRPDKLIGQAGDINDVCASGADCVFFLLFKGKDNPLTIATTCSTYLLSDTGKTLDTLY